MKTRTLLATMLFVMATVTVKAQPMSYYAMRDNARFLTDRMAYTLGLTERLIDDLYMINYDYIYAVNDYLDDIAYGYHYDDYMAILAARDAAIRLLLTPYQWSRFISYDYFYRPIFFQNARWWFGVYDYYPRSTYFYFGVPRHYANYHGGHFFAGMRPARGHVGPGHGFGPHAGRIGDGFRGNDHYHNGNHGRVGGNNRGYHFDNNRGGNRGGGITHNDRNNHGGNHNNGGNPNIGHNGNNGGYSGSYNGGSNGNVRGDHNPGGMNRGGNNGSVRGGSRSNFSSGSSTRVSTPVSEPRTVEIRNNFGSSGRSSMGPSHSAGSVRSVGGGSSNSRPSGFSSAGSSSRSSSAGRSSMSAGGGSRGGHGGVSRGAGRR